jgi:hypothetical protein
MTILIYLKRSFTILSVMLSLIFFACSKNENNVDLSGELASNLSGPNWRISELVVNAEDETTVFSEYLFHFEPSGTVVAVHQNDSSAINGQWQATGAGGLITLSLRLSQNPLFAPISHDWQMILNTTQKIGLVRNDGISTNSLTLERP